MDNFDEKCEALKKIANARRGDDEKILVLSSQKAIEVAFCAFEIYWLQSEPMVGTV